MSAGTAWIIEKLGYNAPEGQAAAFPMLFGLWLGPCTWQGIAWQKSRKRARPFFLAGGWVGLIGVVGVISWHLAQSAHSGQMTRAMVLTAYYSPAILWSLILAISGARMAPRTWSQSGATPVKLPELERFLNAQTMTFTASSSRVIHREQEVWIPFRRPTALRIWAARPACLRIESVADPDESIDDGIPLFQVWADLFVTDGIRQCDVFRSDGNYFEWSAAGSLDRAASAAGLTMAIHSQILFAEDPLGGFIPVDRTEIDGEPVWVLESDEPEKRIFEYPQSRCRLYIDERTELPVRISMLCSFDGHPEIEGLRVDYGHWLLDVDIDPALFDPTPPAGMEPRPPYPEDEPDEWPRAS
jgi:hypothetical protein